MPCVWKTFTVFEHNRNFVICGIGSLLTLILIQDEHDLIIHSYKTMQLKKQPEIIKSIKKKCGDHFITHWIKSSMK